MTTVEWVPAGIALVGNIVVAVFNYWLFKKQQVFKEQYDRSSIEYQIRFSERHKKQLELLPRIQDLVKTLWDDHCEFRFDESPTPEAFGDLRDFIDYNESYLPADLHASLWEFMDLFEQSRDYANQLNEPNASRDEKLSLKQSIFLVSGRLYSEQERIKREFRIITGYSDNVTEQKESVLKRLSHWL